MKTDCGNLYYNARKTAGLTQERWAELLGLSVEAVSQYERGTILPSDEVVLRMAEAAGQQIVCYWHLLNKSRVAGRVLPDIKKRPLPEAVLKLLDAIPEPRFSITDFYVDNAARLRLRSVLSDPGNWVDAGKPETLERASQIIRAYYE